jgi:hypothetical protein
LYSPILADLLDFRVFTEPLEGRFQFLHVYFLTLPLGSRSLAMSFFEG